MTTGTGTGAGRTCSYCAHQGLPDDRFCERCGASLIPVVTPEGAGPVDGLAQISPALVAPVAAATTSGGTTRHLCAAVHLDEEFCDGAVAEFLVEPVRAIPPSPGVDTTAVLREAVAAQARRRIRDAILLALLLVLAVVNFAALLIWVVGAAGAAVLLPTTARRQRRVLAGVVIVACGLLGVVLLIPAILLQLALSSALGESAVPELPTGSVLATLLISVAMLAVLLVDELTVTKLMTGSFRRNQFAPNAEQAPTEWERQARSLGLDSFRPELDRVFRAEQDAHRPGHADVVVHRGFNPFIGAGTQAHRHVIALPLDPSEDRGDTGPDTISVTDLHDHVSAALAGLRTPSSLSPGQRLEHLSRREQVLMPADRLLLNRSAQMHPPVLPDLARPPLTHLPLVAARELAAHPLEWARYYSCFRVECWDRDLTASCYLHIGTDQRMLYLEWTYCILLPVRERYRSIDYRPESPGMAFGRSMYELVLLPISIPRRLRSAFRRRTLLSQRADEMIPARYGAAQSLRELAADTDVKTYFQDADMERYVTIIDKTLFRSIGNYLEQHGYSVVEFMKIADSVTNFNIQGDVIGSALGRGNIVSGNTVGAGARRSSTPAGTK